jgi:hypothetical protein
LDLTCFLKKKKVLHSSTYLVSWWCAFHESSLIGGSVLNHICNMK